MFRHLQILLSLFFFEEIIGSSFEASSEIFLEVSSYSIADLFVETSASASSQSSQGLRERRAARNSAQSGPSMHSPFGPNDQRYTHHDFRAIPRTAR